MMGLISSFCASVSTRPAAPGRCGGGLTLKNKKPIIFFFPAWFLWRSAAKAGDRLLVTDKCFLAFSLLVLFPLTLGLGLTTAIQGLIAALADVGGVFQCAHPAGATGR